ncbi:MAG: Mrp/NBP35 family ATP-binding protein [bacterium]|nr:Mrp/NBP35 family ATP-binding protein [bacterium]
MSKELEEQVWDALKSVRYPGMSRDIVSFGFVRGLEVAGSTVSVELEMSTHNPDAAEQVRSETEEAVRRVAGVTAVAARLHVQEPPNRGAAAQRAISRDPGLLPDVEHVVAVASGKGGVGKSTVSANLAVRMAQLGHKVGLLDADIYGPSMPMMFGITERPRTDGQTLEPFFKYGVKVMSLGFLVEMDTPVIWRGPMVMKALEQMLGQVDWGELDYLIVDLPPGTGDAQLTLTQKVPLSAAVIVTTPQDVALIDARKGLAMFRKVNVPVVGIIENMSGFACPHCGETTHVFKHGGGERTAEVVGTAFLGSIPLDPAIVAGGDAGEPIVVSQSEGPHAEAFEKICEAVAAEVGRGQRPKLKIV